MDMSKKQVNDIIAWRAFELLKNELPSDFKLTDKDENTKGKYKTPGKFQIRLKNKKSSIILIWKSNGKDRDLLLAENS
jgi:hypothetical protein